MARATRLEAELAALRPFAEAPETPEAREGLRKALASSHAAVVARAAKLVRDAGLHALAPDLARAAARLAPLPAERDPGCQAKLALLEALDALDHPDAEPFLRAARHVQLEAAWGPPIDTAAGLRSRAILGLARLGWRDLVLEAARLLDDKLPPVRRAAADALAAHGDRAGAGPLLLVLGRRDEEPGVTTACLTGVLTLAPDWALPRLRAMLTGGDREARLLALSVLEDSPTGAAASLLVEWLEGASLDTERDAAIAALARHRSDAALAALAALVADGEADDAEAAIDALAARAGERAVRERLAAAAARRDDERITAAFRREFG